jgi:DNA polymerase III subunit epsilon
VCGSKLPTLILLVLTAIQMILFFDVETTGLSKNADRIVQLAWILATEDGRMVIERDYVIYPEGYSIPNGATQIHGISTEFARDHGVELKVALEHFVDDAEIASTVVAHNISFDYGMILRALDRAHLKDPLKTKPQICTMRLSKDWCKLPKFNGRSGFKWPKLEELYYKVFSKDFEGAHDALNDTQACMEVYFALVEKGVIGPPVLESDRETEILNIETFADPATKARKPSSSQPKKFEANHNDIQEDAFQKGYQEGRVQGFNEGYARGDSETRESLLLHASSTKWILDKLSESALAYDQLFVISHPTVSNEQFNNIAVLNDAHDPEVFYALLESSPITSSMLFLLMGDSESPWPDTESDALQRSLDRYTFDYDFCEVLCCLARNPSLPFNLLAIIIPYSFERTDEEINRIANSLIQHPEVTLDELASFLLLAAELQDERAFLLLLQYESAPVDSLESAVRLVTERESIDEMALRCVNLFLKHSNVSPTAVLELCKWFYDSLAAAGIEKFDDSYLDARSNDLYEHFGDAEQLIAISLVHKILLNHQNDSVRKMVSYWCHFHELDFEGVPTLPPDNDA